MWILDHTEEGSASETTPEVLLIQAKKNKHSPQLEISASEQTTVSNSFQRHVAILHLNPLKKIKNY